MSDKVPGGRGGVSVRMDRILEAAQEVVRLDTIQSNKRVALKKRNAAVDALCDIQNGESPVWSEEDGLFEVEVSKALIRLAQGSSS